MEMLEQIFGKGGGGSKSLQLDVCYVGDRVLCVGRPWESATQVEEKRNNSAELAAFLQEKHRDKFMMVNLSNRMTRDAMDYHRFEYQVLECDVESISSLEAMFLLCHASRYWLELDRENVLVVFCNNGVAASRLFVSVFFPFMGYTATTHEAVELFYKCRLGVKYDAMTILSRTHPSLRHVIDKAHSILNTKETICEKPLTVFMILVDNLPCTDSEKVLERKLFSFFGPSDEQVEAAVLPIFRLYECGLNRKALVYCSAAQPESRVHYCPRDGKVVLKCDCVLNGDFELECVFAGNTSRLLFRVCMNTLFLDGSGVYTVSPNQLDSSFRSLFPNDFKIDLVMQPADPKRTSSTENHFANQMQIFTTKDDQELARRVLNHLHFIQPDPRLRESLMQKGFSHSESHFALLRTNNSFHQAERFLSETLSVLIPSEIETFDEDSEFSSSVSSCTAEEEEEKHTDICHENNDSNLSSPDFRVIRVKSKKPPSESQQSDLEHADNVRRELNAVSKEDLASFIESFKNQQKLSNSERFTPAESDDKTVDEVRTKPILPAKAQEPILAKPLQIEAPSIPIPLELPSRSEPSTLRNEISSQLEGETIAGPEYDRFKKMLKMGVPSTAVALKMQAEGLDPTKIGIESTIKRSNSVTTQSFRRRKKIHWEAIPEERLRANSIWSKFSPSFQSPPSEDMANDVACGDNEDSDMKELERLFFRDDDENVIKAKQPVKAEKTKVSFVDPKRAQNVGIAYKRLRLESGELCKALNHFDTSILDHEKLTIIAQSKMLPTLEEERSLTAFRGEYSDLGEVEKLFYDIVKTVDSPQVRLDALIYRVEFDTRVKSLSSELETLAGACKEVKSNDELQNLLQVVLQVGNKVNSEEDQGHIQGFTLDSLLKLTQTKSFDRETTVLDFVASFVMKRMPQVTAINDGFPSLDQAKRIQFETIQTEVSSLHLGHQNALRALKLVEEGASDSDQTDGITFRSFTQEARNSLSRLEDEILASKETYRSLLEFFCEDPKLPSVDFFSTLATFLDSFSSAVNRQRESLARERRRQKRAQSFKVKTKVVQTEQQNLPQVADEQNDNLSKLEPSVKRSQSFGI